jgi:hypothetical protein
MDELQRRDLFLKETCNALEIMTNLSYLLSEQRNVSPEMSVYHNMMDDQIVRLTELVKAEIAQKGSTDRVHRHEIKLIST